MAMSKNLWARRQVYFTAVCRIYANGFVTSEELRAAITPHASSPRGEDYRPRVNEWMTDNIGKQWFKRSGYDEDNVPQYVLNIECEAANEPYPPKLAIMEDINQFFSQFCHARQ